MSLKLFNDLHRTDDRPKRETEFSFQFLDRTARPGWELVRIELDAWFSHYPIESQADLRSRFRSKREHNHQSAFFELFLHELLVRLRCTLEIHPVLQHTSRSPDFFVRDSSGSEYYLEAAVVMEYSEKEYAERRRLAEVTDAINDAESPDFFVDIEFIGHLGTAAPIAKLRSDLEGWLASLDHRELSRAVASGEVVSLPEHSFTHGGWSVIYTPRPKNKLRGKPNVRTAGIGPVEVGFSSVSGDIRRTVTAKAKRYGKLDSGYVVAVNVLEGGADRDDMLNALFGDEQVQVAIHSGGRIGETRTTRALNGVWTQQTGPKNTRVSAVLAASPVLPWSILRAPLRVYHNPYTRRKFNSVLSVLPQAKPVAGRIEWEEGETLARLLRLDEDWPGFER